MILFPDRLAFFNMDYSHGVIGLDLSGTPQGAGGVGGLLAVARGPAASSHPLFPLLCSSLNSELKSKVGAFYPCYDANGNVTEYVSASGTVAARYAYDAFGNITAQSGPMAGDFRHRFSTKYYDPETGLSYYIGRYYNPALGRFISSDPIGTKGGLNLYGFCQNDPINAYDYLGMWKRGETIDDGSRRIYIHQKGDSTAGLARLLKLDLEESYKWAKRVDSDRKSSNCDVSVPNVWISADLLRGGGIYDQLLPNLGGTLGQIFGTRLFTWYKKVVKPQTPAELESMLSQYSGDIWGIVVFAHGNKKGTISNDRAGTLTTTHATLLKKVQANGYKLSRIYMMYCFSAWDTFENDWQSVTMPGGFWGYKGTNIILIDF